MWQNWNLNLGPFDLRTQALSAVVTCPLQNPFFSVYMLSLQGPRKTRVLLSPTCCPSPSDVSPYSLSLVSGGFPGSPTGKESTYNAGDHLKRRRHNPLPYFCLGNPMDRGAWQTTVHGITRVEHDLVSKPPTIIKICNGIL